MVKDKVILVTGTSSGIGNGCAEVLMRNGATVVGFDKHTPLDAKYQHVMVDLREEGSIKATVDAVCTQYGRVDGLVNCAGVFATGKPFYEISLTEWNEVLETNLTGIFLMAKYVSQIMIKQQKGKIVNISCIRSRIFSSGMADYAASKGGVVALTGAMAVDLAKDNIQVNSVAPGFTYTGMTEQSYSNPEKKRQRESLIPMGKIAKPEDIANAVLFLLSDLSNYITGETLFVDGGFKICK
ncbi:MAG: hypothetical protein H6Q67_1091 [Firmicutes bacterium]|nr:hypothetical protein [Bacillota bacterium]